MIIVLDFLLLLGILVQAYLRRFLDGQNNLEAKLEYKQFKFW